MPATPLTRTQQREARVRRLINYAKADGVLKKEMQEVMGISRSAFTDKQNNPETFTLGELWKLCDFLHVPDEKRLEILK